MTLDRLILGDNQFFGVNHMSQDKGKERYEQFKDIEEIRKILHMALDNGINAVMFSTHPTIYKITDMMRNDERLRTEMSIYINVPYIIKYVQMVTECGIYETVNQTFSGDSLLGKMNFALKSAKSLVTQNYMSLIEQLVDVEVKPFKGLKIKSIFLHNALVDLAMAYEIDDAFLTFVNHVSSKYNVTPGFITLNYQKLNDYLKEIDIKDAFIMSSINKNGFLMNPSQNAAEDSIRNANYPHIAMATLASGSLKPDEAYEYLFGLGKIDSVIVGASSKKHIEETFTLINEYFEKQER